jgi:hypothetical protein
MVAQEHRSDTLAGLDGRMVAQEHQSDTMTGLDGRMVAQEHGVGRVGRSLVGGRAAQAWPRPALGLVPRQPPALSAARSRCGC